MYSVMLEINQICNLRCNYCYLGDKNGSIMSADIAIRCIDMAFEKIKYHKDQTLWFGFIGGEPLISFSMLKDIVAYIHKKNEIEQYKVTLSITTNGTLFNQEIVDWLVENNFIVKVSIDGNKQINDLNRIGMTNISVHDLIVQNLMYIRQFEQRSKSWVQTTNVITKNNYQYYYESLKYIICDLGFRIIDTTLDETVDWSEEELTKISASIYKSFDLYIDAYNRGKGFIWAFLEEARNSVEKVKKFYYCGAGFISQYVRTDGEFYACPCYMNKGSQNNIGNINKGYILEKLEFLRNINGIDNESCNNCNIYENCKIKGCVMQSLQANNDINKPVATLCYMQKLKSKLYIEKEEILKKISNGELIVI